MRIATQNVAGMRGEYKIGYGPKTAVLKSLVRRDVNFLILTEVRAQSRHVQRIRLKYNLRPTIHQSWALALYFQVRSPLSALFISMDRYR